MMYLRVDEVVRVRSLLMTVKAFERALALVDYA
jgi:hypothetical protein